MLSASCDALRAAHHLTGGGALAATDGRDRVVNRLFLDPVLPGRHDDAWDKALVERGGVT